MTLEILAPISADKPCGDDAKYDDEYLAIEAESDKAHGIGGDSKVNWKLIASQTESLLIKRVKDIKIACRWAFARFMLDKDEGLKEGIETIKALLEAFGGSLFPTSLRAKTNALAWLEEELNSSLYVDKTIRLPASQFENFLILFSGLQESAKKTCGEENLFFVDICQALKTGATQKEKQNTAVQKPIAPKEIAVQTEINADSDALKVIASIKKQAELLQSFWRKSKADDLRALRLNRMIAWLEIENPPFAKDGVTMINPPSAEGIERIENLIQEGKNDEALVVLENTITRNPFWLEGHLLACQILESAGKNAAAATVKYAAKGFVKAFDGIITMRFKGDSPIVPLNVKSWLFDRDEKQADSDEKKDSRDDLETIRSDCLKMLRGNKTRDAIALLERRRRETRSKEEGFLLRLTLVEILFAVGKNEMAIALVGEIENEIQTYKIEEWRPDLATKFYSFLLKTPKRGYLGRERAEFAYNALCRIDAQEAFDIKPN